MVRKAIFVILVAIPVAAAGLVMLRWQLPVGPVVLGLSVVPIAGLILAGRRLVAAVPDMVFGAIDTGLLVIPALLGGMAFGVAGAIAGSVIGDALTDAVAGFFEGGISEWLRERGIDESREAVTSSLGKMSGCLQGAGLVLTLAFAAGVRPVFA
jgi:hypothetical protein